MTLLTNKRIRVLTCIECGEEHLTRKCPELTTIRSCINCKMSFTEDAGYSSYTITHTDIFCSLKLNPAFEGGKELPYDLPEKVREWKPGLFATDCHAYINGSALGHVVIADGDRTDEQANLAVLHRVDAVRKAYKKFGVDIAHGVALDFISNDVINHEGEQ